MVNKKIEYLVVDTSAFINNYPIQDLAENIITCSEVVNEVTSKRQIRRLVVLPYELQVKDVFPEHVKFVAEFSKKTGDYPSLSAIDIKVIALTYQLEIEKVGSGGLHSEPESQKTITFQNRTTTEPKDMAGFYVGRKNDEGEQLKAVDEELTEQLASTELAENSEDLDETAEDAPSLDGVDVSQMFAKVEDKEDNNIVDDEEEDDEIDDDDDDSWITPQNIKEMQKKINDDYVDDTPVKVACITSDFAMQNVLKQIGLHISTMDGRVIKQLRTFILRCYACFKTTSVMTNVFCPNCGHKTLKRVAVSVEPDGSQKIHINLRKPLTARGKKFSLPTFEGGKHANNPVIFADQPMPDQRPTRLAKTKTNIMEDDFIPGFSPFAMRDTTSKSAMLGIRDGKEMKYWMRKNPNEAKRHSSRKKK